ncbi:MAG: DUF1700 domain-containing protein [Lachnospiraceae bacterium]
MNREEYIKRLRHRLKRLPKEDYDRAIAYFTEYFEDAGPQREAQAIDDLGSPELAADQIIRDFAVENASEPAQSVKRSFSALWIGILAVFAAPIALPLALAFGAVLLAMILVAAALIFSVFLIAVSLVLSALPCILVSVWLLFSSFADGLATLGFGLLSLGVGILMTMLSLFITRWCLHGMTRLFGSIAKGGRHYEK